MQNESLMCKGLVERIGIDGSVINHTKIGMDKVVKEVPMKDHKDAIAQVLDAVQNPEYGVVKSMDEIGAKQIYSTGAKADYLAGYHYQLTKN